MELPFVVTIIAAVHCAVVLATTARAASGLNVLSMNMACYCAIGLLLGLRFVAVVVSTTTAFAVYIVLVISGESSVSSFE